MRSPNMFLHRARDRTARVAYVQTATVVTHLSMAAADREAIEMMASPVFAVTPGIEDATWREIDALTLLDKQ